MKTIVCFGDSITWGYDATTGKRLPKAQRWTSVLQRALREDTDVIAEGLVNRTTSIEDPVCPDRNGMRQLHPVIDTHKPVDLVLVMLGTNDLKARFARGASDIAESAARLAAAARASTAGPEGRAPQVALITPPCVRERGDYREMYSGAEEKAAQLVELYARYASWMGIPAFDANRVVAVSDVDGVHLDSGTNETLGRALAVFVRGLLD